MMSHDIYGTDISPMTSKGGGSISSSYGGFVSIVMKTIVVMFVSGKLGEMIFQKSQKVVQLMLQGTPEQLN